MSINNDDGSSGRGAFMIEREVTVGNVISIASMLVGVGFLWHQLTTQLERVAARQEDMINHMTVVDNSREELRSAITGISVHMSNLETNVNNLETKVSGIQHDHDEIIALKVIVEKMAAQSNAQATH